MLLSLSTLFFLLLLLHSPTLLVSSLNQDGLYLHQMKLGFDDPDGAMSDWNPRDSTPCSWNGIKCDPLNTSVVSVDLGFTNIQGPFPTTFLCNLKNLTFISFTNNYINSSLPFDISKCQTLTHLDLSQNLLVGTLPPTLPSLPNLRYLDLTGNNFTGAIPATFGQFPRLEALSLVANLLNETIPSFLGNITTLKQLNLSYNPFSSGKIPPEIGNLKNLEVLWVTECNLVGEIPATFGFLPNLKDLDLSSNNLVGSIPQTITQLSNLVQIELYSNSLSGHLPAGMSNMTSLRLLDASMNLLEGEIPAELCGLELESLNLYENRFWGNLPENIAFSPNLYELRLFGNRLTGTLPRDLGKNSPLKWIDISDNQFSGEIPSNICAQGFLKELLLIDNLFSGKIPNGLSQCRSLTRVRLLNNDLSGMIPVGFWGLPHVWLLELTGNSFSGEISPAIAGASNLSLLLLSRNKFTGQIPAEIGFVDKLFEFSAGDNQLTGTLPVTIGNLTKLGKLDLRNNEISGKIPSDISVCKKLSDLNLANNQFSGKIPPEIGYLPVLNYLDLANNHLTGEIPSELQNLKLNRFNFSSNHLSGKLPALFANQNYKDSFLGNPGLCRDITGLCSNTHGSNVVKNQGLVWLLRSIFILSGVVFVVGILWFYLRYLNFRKSRGVDKSKWTLTSFHKLGFSEFEILDCLDEDNVIGAGASGKVYKAVLSNGEIVAVKKLWGGSRKGDGESVNQDQLLDDAFEAEVGTLGNIRHKNIVRLWCCCTTRDCKILVYEYMPNGSLGDLLHSSKSGLLDWPTRYKIAVDAAEGLSYLHHDCVPPIVHRDVKSNNILLDGEYGARVADFGLAKIVDGVGKAAKSMSLIAGSCGYIAPEYAYTLRVNEKSDTYSFGVVILELVTGKLPVDPEFGEKDLVKWVCTTLEQKGVDHVIDPKLDICFKEVMCKFLNIGLLCTNPLPINRPSMRRVVKMLLEMNKENKIKAVKRDGKLSPYYYEDSSDQGSMV